MQKDIEARTIIDNLFQNVDSSNDSRKLIKNRIVHTKRGTFFLSDFLPGYFITSLVGSTPGEIMTGTVVYAILLKCDLPAIPVLLNLFGRGATYRFSAPLEDSHSLPCQFPTISVKKKFSPKNW